jgi:purine nucleosidase
MTPTGATAHDPSPRHDDAWYRERLAPPTGPVRVVIDTDTANEIDDQFALAWALRCPSSWSWWAVYAEPFSLPTGARSPGAPADAMPFNPPAVGMERSHAGDPEGL